jgi:hypothetical protein
MDAFMVKFRYYVTSTRVFPPSYNHHHDSNDINWWLGLQKLEDDAPAGVLEAFGQAHGKVRMIHRFDTPCQRPIVPLVCLPPGLQGMEEGDSAVCLGKPLACADNAGNTPGSIQADSFGVRGPSEGRPQGDPGSTGGNLRVEGTSTEPTGIGNTA